MVIQYQHESYRGRVELKDPEMKDGDVSVILKNVNINDTGTYECYVGHRQDVQLISIINLIVEPEITAKPGEDVTLQCQGPRDEAVLMLRWTRADLTAEDGYVFFTREKHLSHEKYQHESYRGRVKLKDPEMKDGDVSVILKNVTINDTGTYECYVGYEGSYPKVFNSINLTVEPGNKDGGDKDGGKSGGHKDRNSRGHVGLAVGLSVTVLVGFMFFRKLKRTGQSTNSAPADSSDVS
ncbi:butyrophilin subfamily 2 member A1-like isoform X1 [Anabas testudineus]|uniref:butyrophilin subfamily 2 member A1-like isoform X1 n=1 Tax=Anabas testudineus TaxID=64144 RepID=UPI00143D9A51|nr:butyrophilin subfamily 2 member A1-like isoform X1 [Anabas testudineus]